MILEEKNCIVTIESLQTIDGSTDKINMTVPGTVKKRDGKTYISYNLYYDDTMTESSRETVKIDSNNKIIIIRTGYLKSRLVYEQGCAYTCQYQTPAGVIMIRIDTQKISVTENEDGLSIKINYSLYLDENTLSSVEFTMKVKFRKN